MLVDILIATPGRLVEHILHTPGFTLQHLQFLVLDEADRLLHQSFQNWTEYVMKEIATPKVLDTSLDLVQCIRGNDEIPIIGQRHIDLLFNQRPSGIRNVRKLIFSATLTYDIGKLSSLKMNSPEIISIHTDTETPDVENTGDDAIFSLPTTLQEYAVTGREDKPLVLLYILDKYRLQDKTLIFTHSTETATRLNHLLTQFYKSTKSDITTAVISSEVPLKSRKKLLSLFTSGKLNMYCPL
jgi:ATP-dependent RNA helicase DDX51/DBP6